MNISKELIKTLFCIALLTLSIVPKISISESLILTAAPRESAEKGQKLYGPLTNFISKTLGKSVKYENAGYWLRYQSHIKKKRYDFVLDGPHLASWRIKNLSHRPLIKLPGQLKFYMLTRADNNSIKKPENLIYKRVCVIPPPNLTAMTLLQRLGDPVREPFIVGIKGGMKKLITSMINGECEGTVVRADFYENKLSEELKSKTRIIYTSPPVPNQVITVSPKISEDERKILIDALLSENGKQALAPLIKRFGGKGVVSFIRAGDHEYDNYYTYLEGVVLGW